MSGKQPHSAGPALALPSGRVRFLSEPGGDARPRALLSLCRLVGPGLRYTCSLWRTMRCEGGSLQVAPFRVKMTESGGEPGRDHIRASSAPTLMLPERMALLPPR